MKEQHGKKPSCPNVAPKKFVGLHGHDGFS